MISPRETNSSGRPHEFEMTSATCVVDRVVQGQVESARVVRGADVDDLRPRRDGVCPLDVERLLDVPALRLGRVLREPLAFRARRSRGSRSRREPWWWEPMAAVEVEAVREVGDVLADRRREERAGDRDRLPAAVEAGGVQPVDPVRRVDLGRLVAAEEPRQRARPVRVREVRRGALAPVARARPDGRAGGRRRGRVDVRVRERHRAVEAGDRADERRDGGGHDRVVVRRAQDGAVDAVHVLVHAERLLDLGDRALGRHEQAVRRARSTIEKPSDESQRRTAATSLGRRREAGVELARREPPVVARRRRVVEVGEGAVELAVCGSTRARPRRRPDPRWGQRRPGWTGSPRPGWVSATGTLPCAFAAGAVSRPSDAHSATHGQGRPQPSAHLPSNRSERRSSALPIG